MGFDPGTFVFVIRWGWPAVGPETTPFEPDLDDASVGNTDCLGDRRLFMVGLCGPHPCWNSVSGIRLQGMRSLSFLHHHRVESLMRVVSFLALCASLFAFPLRLSADGLHGRVVDDLTGDAIAGALVRTGELSTLTDSAGLFGLSSSTDSLTVSHIGFHDLRVASSIGLIGLRARFYTAPEVIVHAGLTSQRLADLSASVHVIETQQVAAHHHLQDLTDGMANVHWAGGTSRPRYFQIRGIGERSQYAGEGPPSFAVGFVVDDVELSGLGTTAMLFDMDQVEIYRGPQSTVFGPNAMAGLISLRSADPGDQQPQLQASLGGDGLVEFGAAMNVPLTQKWTARLSYGGQRADGFRDNVYLDADDTNGRREQTLRAKLHYGEGNGGRQAKVTLFHSRADNGYDAWAPDNNETFRTYSDNPGRDEQETSAVSVRWQEPIGAELDLLSISSASVTDVDYSFDGDWGNSDFWAAAPYQYDSLAVGYAYQFFDRTLRQRTTWTQEIRLLTDHLPGLGGDGVVGVYAKRLTEQDAATGYLFGGDAAVLDSQFDVNNLALYSQWQRPLAAGRRLLINLRADRHGTDYDGSTDAALEAVRFSTDGWLLGGRMAIHQPTRLGQLFVAVSRGYRPGGINQHPRLQAAKRPYEAETVWNVEAGLHAAVEGGRASITLFHARRRDQQVELSSQSDPGDPNSFVLLTANAGAGWNSGAEVEASYRLLQSLRLRTTAGLLATHTDRYSFDTAQGQRLWLGDRESAHAPTYSIRLGADYEHRAGWLATVTLSATDGFFYSDSHNNQAEAHQQVHGGVGYRADHWMLQLWGRNLLDDRFTTRGFSFALEPPDYQERLYVTHGDPRQIGITLRTSLGSL